MRFVLAAAAAVLTLIAACGAPAPASLAPSSVPASQPAARTPAASSEAPATQTPAETQESATSVPSQGVVDLSGLDVCALLSEADVQALTGTSSTFDASGDDESCFWAVAAPGQPEYVELRVFARPTGLSGYTFNPGEGCLVAPVSGIGAEALGAVCETPQHKVFLLAADQGVAVQLLVNEPTGSLDPEALGESAAAALEEITGS